MATPVGAATAAKEAGQPFFEVQLQVGSHVGSAGFGSDGRGLPLPQHRARLESGCGG